MPRLWLLLGISVPILSLPAFDTPKGNQSSGITIQGKVTLNAALAKVFEESKTQIVSDLGDNPTITIDLQKATFWQALDAIADAADARLYLYRPDGKIALVKKNKNVPKFVSSSGIFRVALRRVSTLRDFETGTTNYVASLEVAWEPGAKPLYLETQPQTLVLRDAKNVQLKVGEPTSVWAPIDGKIALAVDIVLPAVPRSSESLSLLKGTLPIRLPSKMLTFAFGTLDLLSANATPRKLTQAEVVCEVTKIRAKEIPADKRGSWTVETTIKIPPGGPKFESFQTWAASNEIYLRSKDGKRIVPSSSYAISSSSSDKVVIDYNFEDTPTLRLGHPEDWNLICSVPASIVEVSIPFEFKDVPLP